MKKILSLAIIYFLLTPISWGDMGYSQEGYNAEVTLTHTSAIDSAWIIFTYNSSRYDSIKIAPLFGGSRFLQAFGLDLDSVGMHSVDIRMYSSDSWSDTLAGGWLHEANPDSTRAYLATGDSTRLEEAAQCALADTIYYMISDTATSPSGNLTLVKALTRTYGFQKTDRVTITFSTHYVNVRDTSTGAFVDKIAARAYADTGYIKINVIPSAYLISDVQDAVEDSIRYDVTISAPGRTIFSRTGVLVPVSGTAVWLEDILDD